MEAQQLDLETEEQFSFVGWCINVREAKRLLAAKKRPTSGEVAVADVASLVGEPGKIVMGVRVDWDRVQNDQSIDLAVPVILAYSPRGNLFPIDGWHRIAKAKLLGVEKLPCLVLSRQDSKRAAL